MPEQEPTGESRNRPAGREVPRFGWRRTLRVALLAAGLALVVAGGAGFVAGRLLASGDGPVRCASWDINRCIPGFDLDGALAALDERGFECEREQFHEIPRVTSTEYDVCVLAQYRITFDSHDGHVSDVSAVVPAWPGVSLTPYQEAVLFWVAVLPFAGQPVPAEAASRWLGEHLDSSVDSSVDRVTKIGDYEYTLRGAGSNRGVVVLGIDAGYGGWFR